ncbi:uncharacterized protein LDX57_008214 [Aspergillus melleus]|uniref:uncharacterized protein n=1 Tax=Aspergillus melleus TaxID=138277 RepID=UPI001E8CB3C8|nr:uncharacterized protein LDX57_008214 [Aspergillus melleus]KAH8430550.1 hypothetical protein LDX57_008214 [Aspergillus melleus]
MSAENAREEAARAFTTADSGVAVLVTTFKVGSCGLNLHHQLRQSGGSGGDPQPEHRLAGRG